MSCGSPEGATFPGRQYLACYQQAVLNGGSGSASNACDFKVVQAARARQGLGPKLVRVHMRLQTELGELASYDGPGHRAHKQLLDPANYFKIEAGLTFLGLAGLMDPPRPEVSKCSQLISTLEMRCGDHEILDCS